MYIIHYSPHKLNSLFARRKFQTPQTFVAVSGLFIDVGTNYSVLDHTNLSFIYEDVLAPGPNADGEFVSVPIAFENEMCFV